jgi:hypothetical protein
MQKMFCKLEKVEIVWTGDKTGKDGKISPICQGETAAAGSGRKTLYDFGGVAEQVKSLKVGECVSLEVAVRAYNDALFLDIMKVEKGQVRKAA